MYFSLQWNGINDMRDLDIDLDWSNQLREIEKPTAQMLPVARLVRSLRA